MSFIPSFIYADGKAIAIHERYSNSNPDTTNYLHRDYQGSVDLITDSAGTELERFSYDAFGKRRYNDWTADPNDNLYGFRHLSDRAYTGHERKTGSEYIFLIFNMRENVL